MRVHRHIASPLMLLAVVSLSQAEDWNAFRGPRGNGTLKQGKAPTKWTANSNVVWKFGLPRPGNGSPIVVGEQAFVTSAEDEQGKKRSLYCIDAKTGKKNWVRTVEITKVMPTHRTNPYCGTTPACDGKHVVVWHGSAGLHCYDMNGAKRWSRDLGEFRHEWGYGTSPLLYENHVILHSGPGEKVFIAAINIANGETVWKADEPVEGTGQRNLKNKYMGSWCTPVVTRFQGRDQLICMMATRVNAYDPMSGKIIWTCQGLRHERGDLAYSSPVIVGNLCFVTGGFRGPAMAIRLGGKGDVTSTHRVWRKANQPQNIGSGIAVDGFVYRPNAGPGTIECIDPKTGKQKWEASAGANQWGSIVYAGKLAYVTTQKGETLVFEPSPESFKRLAINPLRERSNSTPAIANGRIYIRTDRHLFCIGD